MAAKAERQGAQQAPVGCSCGAHQVSSALPAWWTVIDSKWCSVVPMTCASVPAR